jgi:hypothetical protein
LVRKTDKRPILAGKNCQIAGNDGKEVTKLHIYQFSTPLRVATYLKRFAEQSGKIKRRIASLESTNKQRPKQKSTCF